MRTISKGEPFIATIWMPSLFLVGVVLFFQNQPPMSWLFALPFLAVVAFMMTLAEVTENGQVVIVKRWWHKAVVPADEIVSIQRSWLHNVGVIRFRRPILPWGRIYFVEGWSNTNWENHRKDDHTDDAEVPRSPKVREWAESIVAAGFGFFAGWWTSGHVRGLAIASSRGQLIAFGAFILCLGLFIFAKVRRFHLYNAILWITCWFAGILYRSI